tara:strand:- start:4 stop:879 length:876 start_codon:yes stop_codon:yes gene_type:complete
LIFGGTGFLGNEVKNLLSKSDYEIQTVSVSNKNSDYRLDISDYKSFDKLPVNFFNIIINCASKGPDKNYLDSNNLNESFNVNIKGQQNICNWLNNQRSIKKIINCSTLSVIRKPWKINLTEDFESYNHGDHVIYSSSKLFQELLLKTFCDKQSIDLIQIRFSALYGKGMKKNGIIWKIYNQLISDSEIEIFNPEKTTFDFLHVKDAASIVEAVIHSDFTGILNGATGIETSMNELTTLIKNLTSSNKEIKIYNKLKFIKDRAVISTFELQQIINTSQFVKIQDGLSELFSK